MTSERLVCTGCGSTMTDAELIAMRKGDDRILSCCPERKMVLRERVGWQPIETAPRDGTPFLWCAFNGAFARREWTMAVIDYCHYKDCFDEGFWMPLPEGPQAPA